MIFCSCYLLVNVWFFFYSFLVFFGCVCIWDIFYFVDFRVDFYVVVILVISDVGDKYFCYL